MIRPASVRQIEIERTGRDESGSSRNPEHWANSKRPCGFIIPFHQRLAREEVCGINPGFERESQASAEVQIRTAGDSHIAIATQEIKRLTNSTRQIANGPKSRAWMLSCNVQRIAVSSPPGR